MKQKWKKQTYLIIDDNYDLYNLINDFVKKIILKNYTIRKVNYIKI